MLDLRGSMVALVTPFQDGRVDEERFRAFVRWQLAQGTDGLVPCGTTGEGATLSNDELALLVGICVEETQAHGAKIGQPPRPVLAGCGSNSTARTLEAVACAKAAGASGALVVTPYYNKPSQEGLYRHFEKVAIEGDLPLVMYNVPSRTSVDLLPDTIARLSRVPGIAGIKEASGNIARVAEIREKSAETLSILAGDDLFALATLAMGGQGVISVVGNVAPGDLATLCDAFADGNLAVAQSQQIRFAPLVRALFLETNPMPVKHALWKMGRIGPELRLPLVPCDEAVGHRIEAALRSYGIQL